MSGTTCDVVLAAAPGLPDLYRKAVAEAARRRIGLSNAPLALPDATHRVGGLRVDVSALTRFQHLIGAAAKDDLPSSYLHTVAFPVAMSLLARTDFPLPLLGMVHLSNEVHQERRVLASEVLDVAARSENLRPHSAGTQVDVVVEVRVGDELVWTGRSVYLARGVRLPEDGGRPAGAGSDAPTEKPRIGRRDATVPFDVPRLTGVWRLDGRAGRRYAAVSGDWNPIHLNRYAAKALGMKTLIAHGMYLAARMVEQAVPAPRNALSWRIDFAAPVLLPGIVATSFTRRGNNEGGSYTDVVGWSSARSRVHFTGWVRAE